MKTYSDLVKELQKPLDKRIISSTDTHRDQDASHIDETQFAEKKVIDLYEHALELAAIELYELWRTQYVDNGIPRGKWIRNRVTHWLEQAGAINIKL